MKISERKRLEAVGEFEELNLNNNKELNDLVTLTIETCDAPIALISIMGENVQWVKCKSGINITATIREDSFCKFLINRKNVLVVPDTLLDVRFKNNPVVTGPNPIRFYAGAPLITTSGFHIGSLCVLNLQPQPFSKKQKEMLAILAAQVMSTMELQMSVKVIAQHNSVLQIEKEKTVASERKLRAFFNSSASCHTLIGRGLEILDFNKAMAVFIKELYNKKIQAGKSILYYINSSYKNEFMGYIKSAFAGKRTNKEILINDGKGLVWWDISFEPIKDEQGNIVSVANSATNINNQKLQVAEILTQNQSLLNIAYVQSHEYRKPVASIMGLMNVIKGCNYKTDKECLVMMEKAVEELDEKIRTVVKFTEKNKLTKHGLTKLVPVLV